jgi:class 3 adenylate cyclase
VARGRLSKRKNERTLTSGALLGSLAGVLGCVLLLVAPLTQLGLRLTGRAVLPVRSDNHPKVVVVGVKTSFEARRGKYMTETASLCRRWGCKALVLTWFDSATLSDGVVDAAGVRDDPDTQELTIVPLREVRLDTSKSPPDAAGYAADRLIGEFAGFGFGLDRQRRSELTGVPMLVRSGAVVPEAVRGTAPPVDDDTVSPGLALAAAIQLYAGTEPDVSTSRLKIGNKIDMPLERGVLRINWNKKLSKLGDPNVFTFREMTTDPRVESAFRGAVVLLGPTGGDLTPIVSTPVGPMPEILVHANALDTVLSGKPLRPAPLWSRFAILGVLNGSMLLFRRHPLRAAIVVAGLLVGVGVVGVVGAQRGWLIDVVVPSIIGLTIGAGGLVLRQVRGLLERRRLTALFTQYVPSAVAKELIASGRAQAATEGSRHVVTTLFCDLRGFTPMAATLTPGQVRELLNVYYEVLSAAVMDNDGTLLQYTGDEIFAAFGAPIEQADHADRAMQCAQTFFALRTELNNRLTGAGLPEVNYGIGVHSGDVVAAHVGSTARMQYSLIGDTVNVGSRFCSLAREGQIMMSGKTMALLRQPPTGVESKGNIELKGVLAETEAFCLQH